MNGRDYRNIREAKRILKESPLDERAGLADNEGREVPPTEGDEGVRHYLNEILRELTDEMNDIPVRFLEDSKLMKEAIKNIEKAIYDIQRAKEELRRPLRT